MEASSRGSHRRSGRQEKTERKDSNDLRFRVFGFRVGLLGFRGALEVRTCRVGIHMRVLGLQLRLSKLELRGRWGPPLSNSWIMVLNFLEIPKSDIAFVKVR